MYAAIKLQTRGAYVISGYGIVTSALFKEDARYRRLESKQFLLPSYISNLHFASNYGNCECQVCVTTTVV